MVIEIMVSEASKALLKLCPNILYKFTVFNLV